MTKFGSAFPQADPLAKAPGTSHNAHVIDYRNVFDLTVDGGTTEALKVASIGAGVVPASFKLEASGNISATNFTLGTAAVPNKYGTTFAGPNATSVIIQVPIALGVTPTTVPEDIFLTPSANLPSTGSIRTTFSATKR